VIDLPVVAIVRWVFYAIYAILLIRVVLSFLRTPSYTSPWSPIWSFFYAITEPVLAPIRRLLAPYQRQTGLDFSVLVVLVLLQLAQILIMRLLAR
jgi:uncharacterized protein YggT (Ycf19 family)